MFYLRKFFLLLVLVFNWPPAATAQEILLDYFVKLEYGAERKFNFGECETAGFGGATFYRNSNDGSSDLAYLLSAQPGESYFQLGLGLDDFGTNGVCLQARGRWQFGTWGPGIFLDIERSIANWSDSFGYDGWIFALGIEQPVWNDPTFRAWLHFYYDYHDLSYLLRQQANRYERGHLYTVGGKFDITPNPGFAYSLRVDFQGVLDRKQRLPGFRSRIDQQPYATRISFYSLTALGPPRTPSANFAIRGDAQMQFATAALPYAFSCRSGRNDFLNNNNIDKYMADQCYGLELALRYSYHWSLIEVSYLQLGFEYLYYDQVDRLISYRHLRFQDNDHTLYTKFEIANVANDNEIATSFVLGIPLISNRNNEWYRNIEMALELVFEF